MADKEDAYSSCSPRWARIGMMWVTAVTRLEVAGSRGAADNILVILAVIFSIAALALSILRESMRGVHFLQEMQEFFFPLPVKEIE